MPTIPIPANFPVHWKQPGDDELFWIQDRMHLPEAVSPVDATMVQGGFTAGASRAIANLSMPISGIRSEVYNGYTYLHGVEVPGTEAELAARMGEMIRITMELGATVLKDWRETFEPQVLEQCDAILNFDYAGRPLNEVAHFVATFRDRVAAMWEIHMRVNIPPMNAVFGLEEFLGQVLGEDAVTDSRQLLQGFDNKSIALGKAIWDLSRWVRADAALRDAVMNASVVDGKVTLVSTPRTDEFNGRWQQFLDEFGWRSNRFLQVASASWREEQGTALGQLQSFVNKDDSADPYEAHRKQAADRDRLVAELEAKLPEPLRPQFRGMLGLAQQYIPIAEDHNFTIDQKSTMVLRHGLLQFGARLVGAGILNRPDDIFYIEFDELCSLADGDDGADFATRATNRRAEHRRQEQMTPPPMMGTPPPADAPPNPLITKFFGLAMPAEWEGKTLRGLACSAGVVTGTAKVLLSLDEAGKLEPGDIMVCHSTMPAWTPLFAVAGAIVADAGGPLSHCAIVAREYGIPCVAATQVATQTIKDGMLLRVDGKAGTVEILEAVPVR